MNIVTLKYNPILNSQVVLTLQINPNKLFDLIHYFVYAIFFQGKLTYVMAVL